MTIKEYPERSGTTREVPSDDQGALARRSPITLCLCGTNNNCDHDFKGWREFDDGRGGETVCTKCGVGAMAWSLRTGL